MRTPHAGTREEPHSLQLETSPCTARKTQYSQNLINVKKNNNKRAEDLNRQFSKDNIQMAKRVQEKMHDIPNY